jgi:hypothetical protein
MNIRNIFKAAFIIATLFAMPANAGDADDNIPCGMEAGAEGLRIKTQDASICPQDVAFQGTYLLFSEILNDPAVRPFALMFIDKKTLDSPFTQMADNTIAVSGPIHFILSSVAILVWALAGPLIAFKLWQYVNMVKKTGSFSFAESQGDAVLFLAYFFFLVTLLIPMGLSGGSSGDKPPITFGQGMAVVASLPATMGGNYIYSTYLSSTETASQDVRLNDDLLLPMAQNTTNALIAGQMCQINTRQALLNINAQPGSNFFKEMDLGELVDYDQESVFERIDKCLSYVGNVNEGEIDDTIKEFNLTKYNAKNVAQCVNLNLGGSTYDSQSYGMPHSCMNVRYNNGTNKFEDMDALIDDEVGTGGDGFIDDTLRGISNIWSDWTDANIDALRDRYKASVFYPRFKRRVEDNVRALVNDETLTPAERYSKLNALFVEASSSVFLPAMANDALLMDGHNVAKQAAHQLVATYLLGASIDRELASTVATVWDNGISALWSESREYPSTKWDGEYVYGLDVFIKESWDAADLLMKHHCAVEWGKQSKNRKFIMNYNRADNYDEMKAVFNEDKYEFQCVKFLHEDDFGEGEQPTNKYATYLVDDPRAFDDYEILSGIPLLVKDDAVITAANSYISGDLAKGILKDYQVLQMVMSGYNMAVKKAVAVNLKDSLSTAQEEAENDIALRPRGWGMFGGGLLYSGQKTNSVQHMTQSIEGAMSVGANGTDDLFIERTAFGTSAEQQEGTIASLFKSYDTSLYLTVGASAVADYHKESGLLPGQSEEDAMQQLMNLMESLILSPMSHIKAASGMPNDQSLSRGLQMCFDEGYENCLSGTKHPVIALSHFGNELIENMVTLMTVYLVLDVALRAFESEEAGSVADCSNSSDPTCKKKGWGKKIKDGFKKFVNVVKLGVKATVGLLVQAVVAILQGAHAVLGMLMPLFAVLLAVGAVFAFMIPMMAYIFGFMIMALFWVGIFVVTITIPIYCLIKLFTIEKDYQNGFKLFYQDMAGTYFTPIFFAISAVISWSLIVVIMYAINVSFAVLHQGLSSTPDGFSISTLIMNLFLYFIYFVAIFILFRFGLGIMKSMPDMLKEKLHMQKGDEEGYIQSLGFEQYVQAQVVKGFSKMPQKAQAQLAAYRDKGGMNSMGDLRSQLDRAENIATKLGLDSMSGDDIKARGQRDGQEQAMKEAAEANSENNMPPQDIPPSDENGPLPFEKDSNQTAQPNTAQEPTSTPDNVQDTFDPTAPVQRGPDGKYQPVFTEGDSTQDGEPNSKADDAPGKPSNNQSSDNADSSKSQSANETGSSKTPTDKSSGENTSDNNDGDPK